MQKTPSIIATLGSEFNDDEVKEDISGINDIDTSNKEFKDKYNNDSNDRSFMKSVKSFNDSIGLHKFDSMRSQKSLNMRTYSFTQDPRSNMNTSNKGTKQKFGIFSGTNSIKNNIISGNSDIEIHPYNSNEEDTDTLSYDKSFISRIGNSIKSFYISTRKEYGHIDPKTTSINNTHEDLKSLKNSSNKIVGLSQRHKDNIGQSSPEKSSPVIYMPSITTSGYDNKQKPSHHQNNDLNGVMKKDENSLISGSSKNLLEFIYNDKKVDDNSSKSPTTKHDFVHQQDFQSSTRLQIATDVGPDLLMKNLDNEWKACWDAEAGSVYYYCTSTGEASWLPPKHLIDAEMNETQEHEEFGSSEDFFRVLNDGLPRGLNEVALGQSELTLRTREIAAKHKLFSKLRSRYEGDQETEYTAELKAKENIHYGMKEQTEIIDELMKEIEDWE
jgi:hypothetical protein